MADVGVFPRLIGQGWSVSKTPTFQTRIQRAVSGRELRALDYPFPLWQFQLTYDVLRDQPAPQNDLRTLMGFFMACQGAFGTFLYQDPSDNQISGQQIGVGDGTTQTFQLGRTMIGATAGFFEAVTAPNAVTAVYGDGLPLNPFSADPATGLLTIPAPPAAGVIVTVDFSYYFRCRFMSDAYSFENFMFRLWSLKKLDFISVVA